MSTLRTTNIQHASAASANIVLDSSNNVTTANNLTAGGTLACTGNLTVTSGNVILSNGNGIDFSATANSSGTMTSELLDDYEEGTWTPTITFGGGSTGITYNAATGGYYTRIGRIVYAHGFVGLTNKGSSTGSARIAGLPYSVAIDGEKTDTSHGIGNYENITYTGILGLWAGSQGSTTFRFVSSASGTTTTDITNTNFANNSGVMFGIWYVAT